VKESVLTLQLRSACGKSQLGQLPHVAVKGGL